MHNKLLILAGALAMLVAVAGCIASPSGAPSGGSSAGGTSTTAPSPTPVRSFPTFPPPTARPTGGAAAVPLPAISIPTALPAAATTAPNAAGTPPPAPPASTPPPLLTTAAGIPQTVEGLRGSIIFLSDRLGSSVQLYVMQPDGSNPRLCECSNVLEAMVLRDVTSPDGQLFLFEKKVGGSLRTQVDQQIWTHNNRTGYEAMLTGEGPGFPGIDYEPAWSPDSRHIAWVSTTDGNDEIYTHDGVSGENKRLTVNDIAWDKHPSFAPDGSQIVFWSNRDSAVRKQIWVMNLDGSGQHNISRNAYNDYDPIWVK